MPALRGADFPFGHPEGVVRRMPVMAAVGAGTKDGHPFRLPVRTLRTLSRSVGFGPMPDGTPPRSGRKGEGAIRSAGAPFRLPGAMA
jgi:hypothetical protein